MKPILILLFLLLIAFAPTTLRAQDDSAQFRNSALSLIANVQKAQFKKIAVLPVLFEHEKTGGETKPILRPSAQGSLYAEKLQNQLSELSNNNFRLVDSMEVADGLAAMTKDFSQLKGTGKEFQALKTQIEGLQGLIVGTIRFRPLEAESVFQTRDIVWKLYDLADGSLVTSNETTKPYSLADDIYNGRSQEYYRWEKNSVLRPVGFGMEFPGSSKISLSPSDSLELHRLHRDNDVKPHPIFNPNCPFKVKFKIDGNVRPVMTSINPQVEKITPMGAAIDERKVYMAGHNLTSSNAYLPMQPGESLEINVKNSSAMPVLAAVLVDGINILGKKRELPDERSRTWSLEPGKEARFDGWYEGQQGKEDVSKFVITRLADSVAGKLGQKDHTGMITLVFYSVGWPNRNAIVPYAKPFFIVPFWNPGLKKISVVESQYDIYASGMDGFAMGGKKPQPNPLQYKKSEPQGVILCSMTVHYAPESDVPGIEKAMTEKWDARWKTATTLGVADGVLPLEKAEPKWIKAQTNWPE